MEVETGVFQYGPKCATLLNMTSNTWSSCPLPSNGRITDVSDHTQPKCAGDRTQVLANAKQVPECSSKFIAVLIWPLWAHPTGSHCHSNSFGFHFIEMFIVNLKCLFTVVSKCRMCMCGHTSRQICGEVRGHIYKVSAICLCLGFWVELRQRYFYSLSRWP